MRKRGKTIIWPQYMDKNRSRRLGRRLSKEKAIPLPNIKELKEAADELGYTSIVEPFPQYPRTWWDPKGYLLIDMMGQEKIKVIEKIAARIEHFRRIRKEEEQSKKGKKKKKKKT